MNLWLIRHPDHTIERPISEEVLIERIESGELRLQDEICRAGSYWISLYDAVEVRRFLGDINLSVLIPNLTDSTLTSHITEEHKVESRFGGTSDRPMDSNLKSSKGGSVFGYRDDFSEAQKWPQHERSLGSRLIFILILCLVFLGTLFLLWKGAR